MQTIEVPIYTILAQMLRTCYTLSTTSTSVFMMQGWLLQSLLQTMSTVTAAVRSSGLYRGPVAAEASLKRGLQVHGPVAQELSRASCQLFSSIMGSP